jgi:hypothetical protein
MNKRVKFHDVESSNIARVAYDNAAESLHVEFKNGSLYVYSEVPQTVFEEMLSARSVGKYFGKNVRDVYPFDRA